MCSQDAKFDFSNARNLIVAGDLSQNPQGELTLLHRPRPSSWILGKRVEKGNGKKGKGKIKRRGKGGRKGKGLLQKLAQGLVHGKGQYTLPVSVELPFKVQNYLRCASAFCDCHRSSISLDDIYLDICRSTALFRVHFRDINCLSRTALQPLRHCKCQHHHRYIGTCSVHVSDVRISHKNRLNRLLPFKV